MDFNKNISDILLLYELSMAIGKTLDYRENCANFLQLFLPRKGLTGAWILAKQGKGYKCNYAIPELPYEAPDNLEFLENMFMTEQAKIYLAQQSKLFRETPKAYHNGAFTIFNLKNQGILVVHSNRENPFSDRELNQLRPIMSKFMHSLQGATLLAQQQRLLQRLEDQNRRLNDYAHVVSHDLKSPLRNINILAKWIADDHGDVLPDQAAENLRLIQQNTERMERLIRGLLHYSSVSEPKGNMGRVGLNKLVKEILAKLSIPNNISISVGEMPDVYGFPNHFEQLFQNLIDNAVKAMDKKEGKIEVGFYPNTYPPEFFVADNGKGIDPKYHERIFKIFEKLDSGGTQSGIGLSIVQRIIEHYKGDIWLESEVGKGSTFHFILHPLDASWTQVQLMS
jgi:signal transduction histidine kinase